MKRFTGCLIVLSAIWFSISQYASAQKSTAKKPLDHSCYDKWNSIFGQKISNDGNWVFYTLRPGKGDSVLKFKHTSSTKAYSATRGSSARFSDDSKLAVYLVRPNSAAIKKALKEKKPRPKTELVILDLASGKSTKIAGVSSFRLPVSASGWLAYQKQRKSSSKSKTTKPKTPTKGKPPTIVRKGGRRKTSTITKTTTSPAELVLRNLRTGKEITFADVTSYVFTKDGKKLALTVSAKDKKNNGILLVATESGKADRLIGGPGDYRSVTFDKTGKRLAFLTNRDDQISKKPAWSIYLWQNPMTAAQALVNSKTKGMRDGWQVTTTALSFSKAGGRIFFNTRPAPAEPKKSKSTSSKKPTVKVDIWHWKDPYLQPQQLAMLRSRKNVSYRAVLHVDEHRVVQLADKDMPAVTIGNQGDADVALGSAGAAYRMISSWDYPSYRDLCLVDVKTGKRTVVLKRLQGIAYLSPQAKYLTWYDNRKNDWCAMSIKTRKAINLTKRLPYPVHNELHDQPARPAPYGTAGWLKGDKALLVYDRYDIWAVDPNSVLPPVCITDKFGRQNKIRFRYSRIDSQERAIDPGKPLLLSAFDAETKATGYYRDRIQGTKAPVKLIMRRELLASLQKAKKANKVLLRCSTFQKYPDLWTGDFNFRNMKKLSDANPQQKDYRWGAAELVSWTSLDGKKLNGILYKPEDFSLKKKYPMLVYFYERMSDRLHRYITPAPGSSSINVSFYVSRGYVVFIPDIPYRVGHPGQSCVNAVLPGIANIVNRGFVNPKRIGVQGHSWGGYQIAYLVTKTKLFAAAEAGAPVSNMTSAYGGIRWSSGKSRMFQYEKTQSRIGGTLWNAQHRYIENSPVFWADRVTTPLLMMHNDKDGAVPWYQGIEMFVALRRLGKPCWLINYNDENHGLIKKENRRDWTVRLQQYFDHYLKGAPAPVWLSQGVPAKQKGKTLGLDLAGGK